MSEYYDRYAPFRRENDIDIIPFLPIYEEDSDLYILYDKSTMRLDMLSYKYYGDCNYGWLILQANPQYGGWEFSILNGALLRIPYPISSAITRYELAYKNYVMENE